MAGADADAGAARAEVELQNFDKFREKSTALVRCSQLISTTSPTRDDIEEVIRTCKHWLVRAKQLFTPDATHWWEFIERTLQLIKETSQKHKSAPELVVQELTPCHLGLTCIEGLSTAKLLSLVSIFNVSIDGVSRALRNSMFQTHAELFRHLAKLLVSCGDYETQLDIMHCVLKFVPNRTTREGRVAAGRSLLPPDLYSIEALEIFHGRTFSNFNVDSRRFINAVNRKSGSVVSFLCQSVQMTQRAGQFKFIDISGVEDEPMWVNLNLGVGTLSLEINGEALQKSCAHRISGRYLVPYDFINIPSGNVTYAVMQKEKSEVVLRLECERFPRILEASNFDEASAELLLSHKADLRSLDSALRRLLGENYECLFADVPEPSQLSPQAYHDHPPTRLLSSEDEQGHGCVSVAKSQVLRAYAEKVDICIYRDPGKVIPDDTSSCTSMTKFITTVRAHQHYAPDKHMKMSPMQPVLSKLTEERGNDKITFKVTSRPIGIIDSTLNLPTDTEIKACNFGFSEHSIVGELNEDENQIVNELMLEALGKDAHANIDLLHDQEGPAGKVGERINKINNGKAKESPKDFVGIENKEDSPNKNYSTDAISDTQKENEERIDLIIRKERVKQSIRPLLSSTDDSIDVIDPTPHNFKSQICKTLKTGKRIWMRNRCISREERLRSISQNLIRSPLRDKDKKKTKAHNINKKQVESSSNTVECNNPLNVFDTLLIETNNADDVESKGMSPTKARRQNETSSEVDDSSEEDTTKATKKQEYPVKIDTVLNVAEPDIYVRDTVDLERAFKNHRVGPRRRKEQNLVEEIKLMTRVPVLRLEKLPKHDFNITSAENISVTTTKYFDCIQKDSDISEVVADKETTTVIEDVNDTLSEREKITEKVKPTQKQQVDEQQNAATQKKRTRKPVRNSQYDVDKENINITEKTRLKNLQSFETVDLSKSTKKNTQQRTITQSKTNENQNKVYKPVEQTGPERTELCPSNVDKEYIEKTSKNSNKEMGPKEKIFVLTTAKGVIVRDSSISSEKAMDSTSTDLGHETSTTGYDTPAKQLKRKRKLYSVNDDSLIGNEVLNVQLSKPKIIGEKKRLSSATCYKEIEKDRAVIQKNRKRTCRKEKSTSPRTKKNDELFDQLRSSDIGSGIEGHQVLTKKFEGLSHKNDVRDITVYNFSSDSDNDFREKIVKRFRSDSKERLSTINQRNLVIKSNTKPGVKNMTPRRKRVQKKKKSGSKNTIDTKKESQKNIIDSVVLNDDTILLLEDEKTREAPPDNDMWNVSICLLEQEPNKKLDESVPLVKETGKAEMEEIIISAVEKEDKKSKIVTRNASSSSVKKDGLKPKRKLNNKNNSKKTKSKGKLPNILPLCEDANKTLPSLIIEVEPQNKSPVDSTQIMDAINSYINMQDDKCSHENSIERADKLHVSLDVSDNEVGKENIVRENKRLSQNIMEIQTLKHSDASGLIEICYDNIEIVDEKQCANTNIRKPTGVQDDICIETITIEEENNTDSICNISIIDVICKEPPKSYNKLQVFQGSVPISCESSEKSFQTMGKSPITAHGDSNESPPRVAQLDRPECARDIHTEQLTPSTKKLIDECCESETHEPRSARAKQCGSFSCDDSDFEGFGGWPSQIENAQTIYNKNNPPKETAGKHEKIIIRKSKPSTNKNTFLTMKSAQKGQNEWRLPAESDASSADSGSKDEGPTFSTRVHVRKSPRRNQNVNENANIKYNKNNPPKETFGAQENKKTKGEPFPNKNTFLTMKSAQKGQNEWRLPAESDASSADSGSEDKGPTVRTRVNVRKRSRGNPNVNANTKYNKNNPKGTSGTHGNKTTTTKSSPNKNTFLTILSAQKDQNEWLPAESDASSADSSSEDIGPTFIAGVNVRRSPRRNKELYFTLPEATVETPKGHDLRNYTRPNSPPEGSPLGTPWRYDLRKRTVEKSSLWTSICSAPKDEDGYIANVDTRKRKRMDTIVLDESLDNVSTSTKIDDPRAQEECGKMFKTSTTVGTKDLSRHAGIYKTLDEWVSASISGDERHNNASMATEVTQNVMQIVESHSHNSTEAIVKLLGKIFTVLDELNKERNGSARQLAEVDAQIAELQKKAAEFQKRAAELQKEKDALLRRTEASAVAGMCKVKEALKNEIQRHRRQKALLVQLTREDLDALRLRMTERGGRRSRP